MTPKLSTSYCVGDPFSLLCLSKRFAKIIHLLKTFNKQARPWEHACSWGPTWPSSSGAASRTVAWVGCHLWRAWFGFPSWHSPAHALSWWKTAGPITGLEIQLLWRLQVHHTREESYSSHPSRTSILKVISLLKRKDPLHQATGQQSRGHLLQEELCQFLQLWPGRRRMIGTTGWISGGGVATQLPACNRGWGSQDINKHDANNIYLTSGNLFETSLGDNLHFKFNCCIRNPIKNEPNRWQPRPSRLLNTINWLSCKRYGGR